MNLLKMADMQQIDVIIDDINGAGLGIPCEKMSLQWSDKLCNGMRMVLEEVRRNSARCADEL